MGTGIGFIDDTYDDIGEALQDGRDSIKDAYDSLEDRVKDPSILGDDFTQIWQDAEAFYDTVRGKKAEEAERLNQMQSELSSLNDKWLDIMANEMFLPEIFQMANQNRYSREVTVKQELLEKAYERFKDKYDNIDGIFTHDLAKIMIVPYVFYTMVQIVGGLVNDFEKALEGDMDAALSLLLKVGTAVLATILFFVPGMQVVSVAMFAGLLWSLQAEYADSALTKLAFEVLDQTFEAVGAYKHTNLEEWFAKDGEYYEMSIGYTNLGFQLYLAYAGFTGVETLSEAGNIANGAQGAKTASDIGKTAQLAGSAKTFKDVYDKFQTGMQIYNLGDMYHSRNDLKDKLEEQMQENMRRESNLRKMRFMTHARDLNAILEEMEMNYYSYLLQLENGNPRTDFDPEQLIPMNTRFRAKDEISFGYENTFRWLDSDDNAFYKDMIYGANT